MIKKSDVQKKIIKKKKNGRVKQICKHKTQLKNNLELGKNPASWNMIDYAYKQCQCVYIIISKPEWYNLLDANENKLIIPPAWYVGCFVRSMRLLDHEPAGKAMTKQQVKKSAVLRYIKENNLKQDLNYYFDIYVLNFTDFFVCFARVKHGNGTYKSELAPYLVALEFYIKYNLYDFFTDGEYPIVKFNRPVESKLETKYDFQTSGTPVIQRLYDVWKIPKEEYLKYNIEKPKKVSDEKLFYQNEIMLFFQKLYYSSYKYILDNALKPVTQENFKEWLYEKAQKRKRNIPSIYLTNKTLLP